MATRPTEKSGQPATSAKPLDPSSTLDKAAAHARTEGPVRVATASGEVWVVAPKGRLGNAPGPFDEAAEGLLEPPLARAAYSDRTAWLMAVLSQLAYQHFERGDDERKALQATLADAGIELVTWFDAPATGTQAFLARSPGRFAALVFRGTEKDMKDILTDLDARFLDTAAGKTHRGFATAFESISSQIEEALSSDLDDSEPVYLAGHSLGGALATVAAQELGRKRLIAACYTYGSPRVGTAEWSDAVKAPVYRVVNGADGVPTVPGNIVLRWILVNAPMIPLLGWLKGPFERIVKTGWVGYQHVGDQRFLGGLVEAPYLKSGSAVFLSRLRMLVVSPVIGLFRGLSQGKFNYREFSGFYTDHAISAYVAKLRKIALERN
jgi:hypothetical protein